MNNRIGLKDWAYFNAEVVQLTYEDNSEVYVDRADFERAFGAIVNASKEDVVRDFELKDFQAKELADSDVYLKDWIPLGDDVVQLTYEDESQLYVHKRDFDRAFGAIVNAPKAAVSRDFPLVAVDKVKAPGESFDKILSDATTRSIDGPGSLGETAVELGLD